MKNGTGLLLISLIILNCVGCTFADKHTYSIKQTEDFMDTSSLYHNKEKNTAMNYEELQKQYDNYISLAWKAKLNGSLTEVLQHYEKAIHFNDSIQKLTQTETIYAEEFQHMMAENAQFKQMRQWLLIVGIPVMLLSISGGIFFIIRRRKRNVETDKQQLLLIATFKQSKLYQQILQAAKDDNINISPISQPVFWVSIQENLDYLFSDFTKRLLEKCPDLSETEQQICWLSKLNIQPSGIARILKLSRQAITNARSRIIKKATFKEGRSISFDHFIEKI